MRKLALALIATILAACGQMPPAAPDAKVYADALANPARFAKDRERDASRKPDQVFAFLGVAPGMHVLDVFSGGGYTSEYAAWLVGPKGHVTSFNPNAFENFVKDEVAERFAGDRLKNVERTVQNVNTLVLPAATYDVAVMVQNYHDVYWVKEPMWPKVDGPRLLARIKAGLKPGGVLGIIDHAAAEGTGIKSAQTMHRIEKAKVIADLTAAGFVFEGESAVLANPADDHGKSVFDDSIRGKTDQFVLKFRKPK